jgi:hypothetical protein
MSLGTGITWTPELVSTSSTTFIVQWELPRLLTTPANGCEITTYAMELSKDDGLTFSEIDSAQVRDKPNLLEHTLETSNFDASELGNSF